MSGASSLRNAVKRITHKERAQPSDRKRLGLLEKHKDYIERAKDYKKKKNAINTLRKKANERNPDEFYFRMHNSQVQQGKHRELSRNGLDGETIQLLKTQDLGYILHKKAIDQKKIERLKENIQLIGDVHPRQHVLFVDDEKELRDFHPVTHFQTLPELVDRHYNRVKASKIEETGDDLSPSAITQSETPQTLNFRPHKNKRKQRSDEVVELNQRVKRVKKTTAAVEELMLQRNLARSKGARKKIVLSKSVGKEKKEKEVIVYKWRRERAR